MDVIETLTDSGRPSVYWVAMKARVKEDDGFEVSTICRQLKLEAPDGKMRETDCANTEGIFRIVQTNLFLLNAKPEPTFRYFSNCRAFVLLLKQQYHES